MATYINEEKKSAEEIADEAHRRGLSTGHKRCNQAIISAIFELTA